MHLEYVTLFPSMEILKENAAKQEVTPDPSATFLKHWHTFMEDWLLNDKAYGRPDLTPAEITSIDGFISQLKPIDTTNVRRAVRDALVEAFARVSRNREVGRLTGYGQYDLATRVFADPRALEEVPYHVGVNPMRTLRKAQTDVGFTEDDRHTKEACVRLFDAVWQERLTHFSQSIADRQTVGSVLDALQNHTPIDVDQETDDMVLEIFELSFKQVFQDYFKNAGDSTSINAYKSTLEQKLLWRIPEVMPQNAKANRPALLRALQAMEGGENSLNYRKLMKEGGRGESGIDVFAAIDAGQPPQKGGPYYRLNIYGTQRYYIDVKTFDVYYSVGHGSTNAKRAERHGFLLFK